MTYNLNRNITSFRWAVLLLVVPMTLILTRTANAMASEGQYKLLALYSIEVANLLNSNETPKDLVTCTDGVLNTLIGASLYYFLSETTIVCQRHQTKNQAHWIIHTAEAGLPHDAEGHSFQADSQNIFGIDCFYDEVYSQNNDSIIGWRCERYTSLHQAFSATFPPGSKRDEPDDIFITLNLTYLRNLIAP